MGTHAGTPAKNKVTASPKLPKRENVSTQNLANTEDSGLNHKRLISGFLADYHELLQTSWARFLPISRWYPRICYWVNEVVNDDQTILIQTELKLNPKRAHQYAVSFSTIKQDKPETILILEFDPASEIIEVVGYR